MEGEILCSNGAPGKIVRRLRKISALEAVGTDLFALVHLEIGEKSADEGIREFVRDLPAAFKTLDLAVIRIEKKVSESFTVAPIGDSSKLIVGQDIIAIGNPLGSLGGTVTEGIVSATARTITVDHVDMTLLQISAPINPGNSGGGLFNMAGELVGIVNAKESATGVEGLGFAIPIDLVLENIVEIIEDGYIHGRACLDLDFKAITNPTDAFYLYRNQSAGIYIQLSRYDEALDLSAGDRIHAINGIEIRSESDLHSVLATLTPGDEVQLTVGRVKAVTSGVFTSYKEEYFEVTGPRREYVPASSITFR